MIYPDATCIVYAIYHTNLVITLLCAFYIYYLLHIDILHTTLKNVASPPARAPKAEKTPMVVSG